MLSIKLFKSAFSILIFTLLSCSNPPSSKNDSGTDIDNDIDDITDTINDTQDIEDTINNNNNNNSNSKNLSITIVDVGQGDSTIIQAPSGKILVFDTGRKVDDARHLGSLLWNTSSDDVIFTISHYDSDHMGAMDRVICGEDEKPGISGIDDDGDGVTDNRDAPGEYGATQSDDYIPFAIYDRGTESTPSTIEMDEYFASTSTVRGEPHVGDIFTLDSTGLEIEVLAVNGYIIGDDYIPPGYENDRSIVLLLSYGGFQMLLPGDLPKFVEVKIAEKLALRGIDLDIIHTGHHGSKTSTDPETLALLTPEIAVISVGDSPSCGKGLNAYGHPSQETFDALNDSGVIAVFQTEEGGASMEPGTCYAAVDETFPRDYHSMSKIIADGDFTITTDGLTYSINVGDQNYPYNVDTPSEP